MIWTEDIQERPVTSSILRGTLKMTSHDRPLNPYQALWKAVVRQAVTDRLYLGREDRNSYHPEYEIADASRFLFHSEDFKDICHDIGLPYKAVRSRLKRVEKALAAGVLQDDAKLIPGRTDFVMGDIDLIKFAELEGLKLYA